VVASWTDVSDFTGIAVALDCVCEGIVDISIPVLIIPPLEKGVSGRGVAIVELVRLDGGKPPLTTTFVVLVVSVE
jgi:hypothetical protein